MYTALGFVSLFVGGALFGSGQLVSDTLFILSALLFVGAVVNFIQFRRHRYNIQDLLSVHENELTKLSDDVELPSDGWLYCPNCGQDYDPRLHICPRCNRIN